MTGQRLRNSSNNLMMKSDERGIDVDKDVDVENNNQLASDMNRRANKVNVNVNANGMGNGAGEVVHGAENRGIVFQKFCRSSSSSNGQLTTL